MIYFVRAGRNVKIGVAEDPRSRIATLQTASPVTLKIMAIAPGSFEEERAYHALFANNHKRGEWYRITPDIKQAISEVRASYPDLQLPRYDFGINAVEAVRLVVNTAVAMADNEPAIDVRSVTESRRGPGILIWIPGYVSNGDTIIVASAGMREGAAAALEATTPAPQEEPTP